MKIAVCISGQSRTWFTAKDNIKNFFGDVDYFIHTWDINTYNNYKGPNKYEPINYKTSQLEKINIINNFEPKLYEFEKFENLKNNNNNNNTYSSWYPMYYSFMKSVWLKRKYELEHDFVYDIVIKARFDINYKDKFLIHDVNQLVAYGNTPTFHKFVREFNYNCFDDAIFYADSPTMDIISNIDRWISDIHVKKNINNEYSKDPESYYGPGTLLYKYLVNNGIHPRCDQHIKYFVVRKEAEDLNLNSTIDIDKIFKISNDYYIDIKINQIFTPEIPLVSITSEIIPPPIASEIIPPPIASLE